ncbi:MAG TPA: hypothetical protein VFV47_01835 [Hyphomicrobiaceae bacterium]|nr:hypothetical protein [Hyphomicrobiaceae bacterium]
MLNIARALVALLSVLAPITAAAAPPAKSRFESPQHILQWINTYRLKPEPAKVPDAVRAMSALGLFRDLDAGGVYLGFIAGVIGSNPATADALVARMFPMPPEDQVVLVRAIAYSGLPAWKPLLQKFAERMPARKVLIDRHLTDKLPSLDTLPLDQTPAALDVMWGYYFATGKFGTIDRIVSALAWAKDQNNVERLTLGSMAKWTLAQNAQSDKALLDHLKVSAKGQSKEISKELDEIVEAAETFETTRIRRDALAAIEELKRKGPASARNISWWGQAGQTALAVGCVVASALGQVQVGIPCVIGGAASSAALRFLAPQP